MNQTGQLARVGQSVWLDNITRPMLDDGRLRRYVDDFSVTGLTSNPTIFDEAIGAGGSYDAAIVAKMGAGRSAEETFVEIALDDLRRAADILRSVHTATGGRDGYVSMEVSPLLAADTTRTIAAAAQIFRQAGRPNLLVKIPGTPAGLPAIEESIFAGVPVNVTLLFSCSQYLAAAEAYLRAIERRVSAGLDPRVASVASLFVSRWDKAVADRVPQPLHNRLGIAIARVTYRAYCELLNTPRWQRLARGGALRQTLLWASTGAKDPLAPDTLYVEALAAPNTIDTIPEQTLRAFADHGRVAATMPVDGGDADSVLVAFRAAGVDTAELANQLQLDGAESFVHSWTELLARIAARASVLTRPRPDGP
jgi:transaldolase